MTEYACTEERFLNDVKDHSMEIIRDDGVRRHIKFSRNGSSYYWFDLITWPGRLCIDGDCGTYVFSRVSDMFDFFRPEEGKKGLFIKPSYWGEKLRSIGTNAGYEEFSEELFRDAIKSKFDAHVNNKDLSDGVADGIWIEIEDEVLSELENGPEHAFQAAYDFNCVDFKDEFPSCKDYTFHYIWCLYAIVWGIKKYDEAKEISKESE
jgi:hypothetical protein